MRIRSTRIGLYAVTLTLLGFACGGRSTIDYDVPSGAAASGGTGGGGKGGSGGSGAVEGGTGGVSGGGAGGIAGDGGTGNGGSGGTIGSCDSPSGECEVCTCKACPTEWESCGDDAGCVAIIDCAVQSGCSGVQCYLGPCQQVIDQNGGPFGSSATLAQQVAQCQNQNNCPCSSGGSGGGGSGGVGPGGGGGSGGGGPVACFLCISQECPAVQDCLFDQACRDGAICAFQQCLSGGGGPNLQCMVQCFGGDFQAALKAFQSFQCFFAKCAQTCGGLIPGLGGGLPGFGGSSGGGN